MNSDRNFRNLWYIGKHPSLRVNYVYLYIRKFAFFRSVSQLLLLLHSCLRRVLHVVLKRGTLILELRFSSLEVSFFKLVRVEGRAVNKLIKLSTLRNVPLCFFCFILFCSPTRSFFRLNHLRKVRERSSHSTLSSQAVILDFLDQSVALCSVHDFRFLWLTFASRVYSST